MVSGGACSLVSCPVPPIHRLHEIPDANEVHVRRFRRCCATATWKFPSDLDAPARDPKTVRKDGLGSKDGTLGIYTKYRSMLRPRRLLIARTYVDHFLVLIPGPARNLFTSLSKFEIAACRNEHYRPRDPHSSSPLLPQLKTHVWGQLLGLSPKLTSTRKISSKMNTSTASFIANAIIYYQTTNPSIKYPTPPIILFQLYLNRSILSSATPSLFLTQLLPPSKPKSP